MTYLKDETDNNQANKGNYKQMREGMKKLHWRKEEDIKTMIEDFKGKHIRGFYNKMKSLMKGFQPHISLC